MQLRTNYILGLIFLFVGSAPLCAETTAPAEKTETRVSGPSFRRMWEMSPQVSVVSASTLTLTNHAYVIPYSESLHGIPTFSIGVSTPLMTRGAMDITAIARLGYGYKQSAFTVRDKNGNFELSDTIRLHSIPFCLGTKTSLALPGVGGIKAGFTTALGTTLVYQNGSIAGINDAFFLPSVILGPSITFFDQGAGSDDWFRGFTFGVNYEASLFTEQRLRSFSFDLSVSILL